jgi:hypothetical protein
MASTAAPKLTAVLRNVENIVTPSIVGGLCRRRTVSSIVSLRQILGQLLPTLCRIIGSGELIPAVCEVTRSSLLIPLPEFTLRNLHHLFLMESGTMPSVGFGQFALVLA